MRIIICLIFIFLSTFLYAQTYNLDLAEPATYSYDGTCSSVTPAQWTVKNDSCYIQTSLINVGQTGYVPITIRINLSGNLNADDVAYIQYSIDGGSFVTDTAIIGLGLAAVFDYDDTLNLTAGQTLIIRISGKTNQNTQFWQVKDGDISVFEAITTMPVEFLYFKGKVDGEENKINFNWATATEINNKYFALERSLDGKNFETVLMVGGSYYSSGVRNYSAIDEDPYLGISYYRIRQEDYDGKFNYTNTISIVNRSLKIILAPNPIYEYGTINILFGEEINEDILIQIVSTTGQLMYNSYNYITGDKIKIDKYLEKGVYYVRVKYKNIKKTQKLLVT